MKLGSILASLLFMTVAAVIFTLSNQMSPGVSGDVGAGFFPRIISILTMICGIIIILGELRKSTPEPVFSAHFKKALAMGSITAIFIYLMPILGFVIVTPIFIAGFLLLLKQRNVLLIVGFSLAVTAIIYFVFRTGLNVRLPLSFLGF